MNILDDILNAQGGAAVQQLGSQVGLAPDQTTAALAALVPALAGGFQRNIQSQGGLESLVSALSIRAARAVHRQPRKPRRSGCRDRWQRHSRPPAGQQGREPRGGHPRGGAAGLSPDVLKRLLPLAATLMMGAFAKQSANATAIPSGLGGSAAASPRC